MKKNALKSLSKITKFFIESGDLISDDLHLRRAARGTLTMAYRKYHIPEENERRGNGYHSKYGIWTNNALTYLNEKTKNTMRIDPNLRAEHAVPINIIIKHCISLGECLNEESDLLENAIEIHLKEHLQIAIVTKDEDKILRDHGLNSKMPDDWDGIDVWARYKKTGLYDELNFIK